MGSGFIPEKLVWRWSLNHCAIALKHWSVKQRLRSLSGLCRICPMLSMWKLWLDYQTLEEYSLQRHDCNVRWLHKVFTYFSVNPPIHELKHLYKITDVLYLKIWMAMTSSLTGQHWRRARRTPCRSGGRSAPWGEITARTLPTTTRRMRPWPAGMRTVSLSHTSTAKVTEASNHTGTIWNKQTWVLSWFKGTAGTKIIIKKCSYGFWVFLSILLENIWSCIERVLV